MGVVSYAAAQLHLHPVVLCFRRMKQIDHSQQGRMVILRVHTHTGPPVRTEVVNNENGSYDLFYAPEQQGDHRVSILLQRKHVKASPFLISV